jgi:hypothetical protein
MNLCDYYVRDISSEVYSAYGKFFVDVEYIGDDDKIHKHQLMFNNPEEAYKLEVGDHFLA